MEIERKRWNDKQLAETMADVDGSKSYLTIRIWH